jgi:hypothetical protein
MLNFSFHNSKLNKLAHHLGLPYSRVVGFDLPAGYTCPMALKCKAFTNRVTGKITDSATLEYRCYAASIEARSTNARRAHWHNFDMLKGKSVNQMATLIQESIPENVRVVRIHASGDFFNKDYFQAWCKVAVSRPDIVFFGYTKFLNYVRLVSELGLPNFKLQYSHGGKMDSLVTTEPQAFVVETFEDGVKMGFPVSCVENPADDYDFIMRGETFSIVLHGTQPAGRKAQPPQF